MTIVEKKYGRKNDNSVIGRRLNGITRLHIVHLKAEIDKLIVSEKIEDIEDIIRMMVLYLMSSLFFTNWGHGVNMAFVPYIEEIDRMSQYNWAKALKLILLDYILYIA